MPRSPKNSRGLSNINPNTIIIPEESSITTPDLQIHLERLKDVSAAASKIFALLEEQITLVSSAIPLQRGHEVVQHPTSLPIVLLTRSNILQVDDLKLRAKAHRAGLKTAFGPLREHLDNIKANFWAKNSETLEAAVRNYVEKRIKEF